MQYSLQYACQIIDYPSDVVQNFYPSLHDVRMLTTCILNIGNMQPCCSPPYRLYSMPSLSIPFYSPCSSSHIYRPCAFPSPLKPSILGTAFLPTLPEPFSTRGTPWITRGSLIKFWSSFAGIRQITLLYSPLKFPVGVGTAALRHKWSEVSSRNDVEDFVKNDEVLKPLFFLARMISSKSRIDGELGRVVSRSCINSLNAKKREILVRITASMIYQC
jgi:hypothetical protein